VENSQQSIQARCLGGREGQKKFKRGKESEGGEGGISKARFWAEKQHLEFAKWGGHGLLDTERGEGGFEKNPRLQDQRKNRKPPKDQVPDRGQTKANADLTWSSPRSLEKKNQLEKYKEGGGEEGTTKIKRREGALVGKGTSGGKMAAR